MDEKPPKTLFYPTRSALTKHNFFSQVEIKKSVTTYFSPCIDEENKKNRNKIGAKMKTLEAKPFDQYAENWKRGKSTVHIDVLEAGASWQNQIGTHALRSHRTVWFVFRCSNSFFFLLETGIAGHERLFTRQMTPQIREKTAKTAVFRQRWQAWKVVRSIAAVRQRPRTPRNWWCSFAFSSLSFDISIKNSMQRWSSDFQGLSCVKIRKMAQGSNGLSTLPLKPLNSSYPPISSGWYLRSCMHWCIPAPEHPWTSSKSVVMASDNQAKVPAAAHCVAYFPIDKQHCEYHADFPNNSKCTVCSQSVCRKIYLEGSITESKIMRFSLADVRKV